MLSRDGRKKLYLTAACLLALLSAAYWTKGLLHLLRAEPIDLGYRWVEQRYIFNRQNPYDVYFAHADAVADEYRPTGRNESIDPAVGMPSPSGYPPWEFFAGYLFFWPKWTIAKAYYAAWNFLALAVILRWTWRVGRAHGREAGLFLLMSVAAVASICTSLGIGQYGIIVVALLVISLMLEEKHWHFAAGLAAGAAAIKPTIAGPFLCVFLVRHRWSALAGIVTYIGVASAVIWAVTGANPVVMTSQMLRTAKVYADYAYGPPNILMQLGVPFAHAMTATTLIGAAAAFWLSWRYRKIPLLPMLGILSVVARLWAYHKGYDNLTLIFLLVALGDRAFRKSESMVIAAFITIGLSLWLPAKLTDILWYQKLQCAIWLMGMIVLCTKPKTQMQLGD